MSLLRRSRRPPVPAPPLPRIRLLGARLPAGLLLGALLLGVPAPGLARLAGVGEGRDAPTRATHRPDGEAGRLDAWTRSFRRDRGALEAEDLEDLRRRLVDLRGLVRRGGAARERAVLALLDLYGAGRAAVASPRAERAAAGQAVLQEAGSEAARLMEKPVERFLSQQVLVVSSGNPPQRRAAAALLLAGSRGREVLMALSVCARGPDEELALVAHEALAGWPDESVHTLFLRALEGAAPDSPSALLASIETHFRSLRLAPTDRSSAALTAQVVARLGAADWRVAAFGTALSHALADEHAVPALIDALEAWSLRAGAGEPVRRLVSDIVGELRERSGRRIGAHAGRWRTWWAAVQRGDALPHDPGDGGPVTEASFFGLRPETDRVTFVIDRSGSMATAYLRAEGGARGGGRKRWTRYDESIEQMLGLLESLGERTRFNVVVFSDGAEVWRRKLVPANAGNRKLVAGWLRRRPPRGGTQLRHGVERAIDLGPDGTLDLERLESDTLIVLCDGATAEGAAWVRPLLRRVNPRARVVVHSVRIGRKGDGTLELLAAETGGRFLVVGDG